MNNNGAVNHIKIAFNSCFKWLKDALFKLSNPLDGYWIFMDLIFWLRVNQIMEQK